MRMGTKRNRDNRAMRRKGYSIHVHDANTDGHWIRRYVVRYRGKIITNLPDTRSKARNLINNMISMPGANPAHFYFPS